MSRSRLEDVGVYLAVGIAEGALVRKALFTPAIRYLVRSAVRTLQRTFDCLGEVHIITDSPWLFVGLQGITLHPLPSGLPCIPSKRWRCATYKLCPGTLVKRYRYLMYLDFDTLVIDGDFLSQCLRSPDLIKMLPARDNNHYTNALLPGEHTHHYSFDSCFILGEARFLDELFQRCWELIGEYPHILNTSSEMPYINRALADLGAPRDEIPLVGGVTWAQNSNDMSQSIYHFNSGNPLHKALRVRKFLSTLSARSS